MKEKRSRTAKGIILAGTAYIPLATILSYFLFKKFAISAIILSSGFMTIGLDAVWGLILDLPNNFLEENFKGFRYWEHYDWGLLFTSFGPVFPPAFGAGLYLIISELFQTDPFSYGEDNFEGTTIVGITMLVITVLSWVYANPILYMFKKII